LKLNAEIKVKKQFSRNIYLRPEIVTSLCFVWASCCFWVIYRFLWTWCDFFSSSQWNFLEYSRRAQNGTVKCTTFLYTVL